MNSPSCGLRVASVVFGFMCLAQLTRIIARVNIIVGETFIHRRISAVAVVITGLLCIWLWRLASQASTPKTNASPVKP